MRLTIWIAGAWLMIASQAALLGCGSGDQGQSLQKSCSEGEDCECRDYNTCSLDCGDTVPCSPSCLNFGEQCAVTCMDDCEVDCQGGNRVDGLCAGQCGVNCDAYCASVGRCIVNAGADSNFLCVNARACAATIDDGSTATCLQVENACQVKCKGTCQVFCDLVGACNVDCDGQERKLCGTGYYVCGMDCPPDMMMTMP
jgi:hypothetical protein